MTATKIKGLQIRKLQTPEPAEVKRKVTDAVIGPRELEERMGTKGLWGMLADFVMVGGDFV